MFLFWKDSEQFNFLSTATPQKKFKYGFIMWFLLFAGYFIFCLNWIVMGNLKGSANEGWFKDFSQSKGLQSSSGQKVTEAVDYSVSFARGLATIFVAWFMVKFTHKWAVLIAMLLNTAALPLIWAPHYSLFVLGRIIMGFGGSMLIILVQPILARFFELKHKGILSVFTSMAYLSGALLANLLVCYEAAKKFLLINWQATAGICAAFSYFPLIFYFIFGKNFLTADSPQEELDQKDLPENTYLGMIKEKGCWFWILWYSFLLVASLIISLKMPAILEGISTNSTFILKGAKFNWNAIYAVFFYSGCFAGLSLGRWNKLDYQRKPFVVLCCCLPILLFAGMLGTPFIPNYKLARAVLFLLAFLFAFLAMGIQPVILYIPHEYPSYSNNPKRLTIFYSYLWGIGYIIFTIYQIVLASLLDMKTMKWFPVGFVGVLVLCFGLFSLFIEEPRPSFKIHPWDKKVRKHMAS